VRRRWAIQQVGESRWDFPRQKDRKVQLYLIYKECRLGMADYEKNSEAYVFTHRTLRKGRCAQDTRKLEEVVLPISMLKE